MIPGDVSQPFLQLVMLLMPGLCQGCDLPQGSHLRKYDFGFEQEEWKS
jgi:hypothetical protein